MKTKKRLLSLLLCGALLFSLCPQSVLAEGGTQDSGQTVAADGLCEHHPEHDADCGYSEGSEGTPCGHEHTEDCYTEVTECVHEHDEACYPETKDGVSENDATPSDAEKREPENCPHICNEESGCVTKELNCQHEHDGACGYEAAEPGQPCGYECRICPVQELIDALPDAWDITAENAEDVAEQLDAISALWAELTDEEMEQVDSFRYAEAIAALAGTLEASDPAPAADGPGVGDWDDGGNSETNGDWTAAGNYDTSWYNTEATEFTLYDAADLAGLAFIVNNYKKQPAVAEENGTGGSTLTVTNPYDNFEGKTIKLADNAKIDLSDKTWTPIGAGASTSFKGTFDGNSTGGSSITGLIINAEGGYVGLFGHVQVDGVVKNVTVADADIHFVVTGNGDSVGGIVGYNYGGTIETCTFGGTIKVEGEDKEAHIGGIVGSNKSSDVNYKNIVAKVKDCTNSAAITTSVGNVGGIAGANGVHGSVLSNNTANAGEIENCENTGAIKHSVDSSTTQSIKNSAGGIAGVAHGIIKNCKNTAVVSGTSWTLGGIVGILDSWETNSARQGGDGRVINSENTGAVTGTSSSLSQEAGGIAGRFYRSVPVSDTANIDGCSNSGAVSAATSSSRVGGILGRTATLGVNISQCVNTGAVTGGAEGTDTINISVGGIAGSGVIYKMTECYNTGTVTSYSSYSKYNGTGGLIGNLSVRDSLTLSNCYNVGDVSGEYYVGGLVGYGYANGDGNALTACYNAGEITGTGSYGGAFGYVENLDTSGGFYWNNCGGVNGYGTALSANAMTDDTNWAVNLGLDNKIWEKSPNPTDGSMTGYLPVLTNNKQIPAPQLERTPLKDQEKLTITGQPSADGAPLDFLQHKTFTLDTEGGSGTGAVTWTSSDPSVAEVDSSSGMVTLKGVGPVSITATKAADETYNSATASYDFTVTQQITAVTITGLGTLMGGSSIATHASVPDDACYDVADPIVIGGGSGYNITWTEDGEKLTGSGHTFAVGKNYTGTLTLAPSEYYRFAEHLTVSLEGAKSSPTISTSVKDGNLTVTISFTPVKEVTITVNAGNGGTVNGGGTFEENTKITVTATPNSGYKFVRWEENGTSVSTSAAYTFTVTANRTLTAVFERQSSGGSFGGDSDSSGGDSGSSDEGGSSTTYYTLTFETNGGSAIAKVTGKSGSTVSLSGYAPTRDGYDFSGWYSDKKLTNKITSIKLTGNKKVYAGWTESGEVNPNTGAGNSFAGVKEREWFFKQSMRIS